MPEKKSKPLDGREHPDCGQEQSCEKLPEECLCCSHRKKERSEQEYKDLIHRLNRIEGQIRGIRGMVERGVYCPDILVQSAAASAALNSFNCWRTISKAVSPRISKTERKKPWRSCWRHCRN